MKYLYNTVRTFMLANEKKIKRRVWLKALRKHLKMLHWVLLLTLTRVCTLASTVFLELVAGRMPLDLSVGFKKLWLSKKTKREIEHLNFASELGKKNKHVVSFLQKKWDAKKRDWLTYRFFPSVEFASTNGWFRPGS